jgi:hypothetical protein
VIFQDLAPIVLKRLVVERGILSKKEFWEMVRAVDKERKERVK